ncbi:hypothetical protein [Desulfitobacterium sp.]|uniref:hypothetical protein n=1 Tax=Desulfitobacterium sp. TaxID=49981 RepID=UPI002B21E501|nr:hypothetical protein [Desulfitobacterium sp.]MEA4902283.1 hypothetical protein [Desulfitobacterium sp.]
MDLSIKQLYDLIFSPIVTPYNLLDNLQLPNYEYINYSKTQNGVIATIGCTIEEDFFADFDYYFDYNNNLQKVIMRSDEGEELVFERMIETVKIKKRVLENLSDPIREPAV